MGSPPRDFDELRAGTPLGPFDLLLPIGEGGMARVWVARVRATGQIVALKTLLPTLAENPSFQQMFLDEARIASRVRHPNVCATYELGRYEGVFALVMEWVDGPSLVRISRPGPPNEDGRPRVPIEPRLAARIVAEMCSGLHAAHELLGDDGKPLAVVHRDVSPHNVLVTTEGQIKLTDFGVAKALGKSHITMAGQIKGKLAYMAPEQLMGSGVDRRADVFALGCVLYEITTGMRPFQGDHDPQVMTAIVLGRYEPPSARTPGFPAGLEEIIVRALANDPDQRFQTADHMRTALEGYLQASGPPVTSRHIAALARARCGEEVEARARALFGAPPMSFGPPEPTEAGSGAYRESPPSPGGRPVLWLAAAAVLGAVLGVGVLRYVHARRKPRVAVASEVAARPPTEAPPTEAPASSATTNETTTVARVVRFRVEPPSALMIVDGVVLPPGTTTVARPEDGGSRSIRFRADKHDETMLTVDATTPDEVDVALIPLSPQASQGAPTSRRTSGSVTGEGGAGASPGKVPRGAGASPAPTASTETPPNPYE